MINTWEREIASRANKKTVRRSAGQTKEASKMKRFYRLLGIAALVAVIAIGLAGCPTDGGSSDGGGSIDTAKLKGTWKNDSDSTIALEFGDVQNAGTPSAVIAFVYLKGGVPQSGSGAPGIEGNVIEAGNDSFKVAFDGAKLRVSEATGGFAGINGLYTKQ
jgi:hypothetical protein